MQNMWNESKDFQSQKIAKIRIQLLFVPNFNFISLIIIRLVKAADLQDKPKKQGSSINLLSLEMPQIPRIREL